MVAIGFVAVGAALICLRVVAEAIDAAVRRHDLRVAAGHLRIEQARKLNQLRMQSEAGRARSRRRAMMSSSAETAPEVPTADELSIDDATQGDVKPAMKRAA